MDDILSLNSSKSPPLKKFKSLNSDKSHTMNNIEPNGSLEKNGGRNMLDGNIDESLYSRQLYVLGQDAMKKMALSNILICGCGGLGVEIAKNVILSGVKSVTIYDHMNTTLEDLSSQFYLNEKHIGENRAKSSFQQLSELNPYVTVSYYTGNLTQDFLLKFNVIVLCDADENEIVRINQFCHSNGIHFILVQTYGLFGRVFCDFGDKFVVFDSNGEPVLSSLISSITQDEHGIVTCLDESRHGLEDGDYVTFSEVKGMQELNDSPPQPIKVLGPYTFSIGNTASFSNYTGGGVVTQVKMPQTIAFKSYTEALKSPEFVLSDSSKFEHPQQLHVGFQSLAQFKTNHQRLPQPRDEADLKEYLKLANSCRITLAPESELKLNEKLLTTLCDNALGKICPLDSVIGGIAAQEVMKACSGKFNPIRQWFYFDAVECLPSTDEAPKSPLNLDKVPEKYTRYRSQLIVFGEDFQEKLSQQKCFLVGAGAIGCELLKLFAMVGLSCGDKGCLTVTDMDTIEKSNLNRQFLFRPWDVQRMKAEVAANAAKVMNPNFNVKHHQNRVGPETERTYNDEFFEALDIVVNALDNIDARIYMDRRCVYYQKPLLESGTLGTKGNTQVVLPHLTESYSSSHDPPEKSIPICTLKNFPNAIEHCLQWARDLFEGYFKQIPDSVNQYVGDPKFLEKTSRLQGNQALETLSSIKTALVDEPCTSLKDAVVWARKRFNELFHDNIVQLLFNFPPDQVTTSGAPFWSGPKRCPKPLVFDPRNETHVDFVEAASLLRCHNFGLKLEHDGPKLRNYITLLASEIALPAFVPKSGVKISVTDSEAAAANNHSSSITSSNHEMSEGSQIEEIKTALPTVAQLTASKITVVPLEFQKDDDTNHHMDFIVATSNLRALNYGIQPADRLKSKLIAGKIIPAIATATSVVAGLVVLELFKIVQGKKKLDEYKNGFFNLAIPYMDFSEPLPPPKLKYYDKEFTLWDRFDVKGDMTLQNFLKYFKEEYKLEVTMLSHGVSMLYSFFTAADKKKERMPMKMTELVRKITKKKIDPWIRALVFEICCNDESGEDVEVPYVKYVFPSPINSASHKVVSSELPKKPSVPGATF